MSLLKGEAVRKTPEAGGSLWRYLISVEDVLAVEMMISYMKLIFIMTGLRAIATFRRCKLSVCCVD